MSDKIGRTITVMIVLLVSAACSMSVGWLTILPMYGLLSIVLIYGFFVVMETAVFKAGLSELVELRYLGAALRLQSFLGFGAAILSPALFGLVLDVSNPGVEGEFQCGGGFFGILGLGALIGPVARYFLRRLSKSMKMAGGKRIGLRFGNGSPGDFYAFPSFVYLVFIETTKKLCFSGGSQSRGLGVASLKRTKDLFSNLLLITLR